MLSTKAQAIFKLLSEHERAAWLDGDYDPTDLEERFHTQLDTGDRRALTRLCELAEGG